MTQATTSATNLAYSDGQPQLGFNLQFRGRFDFFDTQAGWYYCGWGCGWQWHEDYVEVRDQAGSPLWHWSGQHSGPKVTPWLTSPTGRFDAVFWPDGDGIALSGVGYAGYDYRRYTAGATPYFPPLRFPGQYHDVETDLFENWNRYYDPTTGRYLSPEPMLEEPLWVQTHSSQGQSTPTYAYAFNNALLNVDPDGLGAKLKPGTYHPPSGVSVACRAEDSCQTIAGKMALIMRMINSHTGWDRSMPSPRGGGRHANEINDMWTTYARCESMWVAKCGQQCDAPTPAMKRVPLQITPPEITPEMWKEIGKQVWDNYQRAMPPIWPILG